MKSFINFEYSRKGSRAATFFHLSQLVARCVLIETRASLSVCSLRDALFVLVTLLLNVFLRFSFDAAFSLNTKTLKFTKKSNYLTGSLVVAEEIQEKLLIAQQKRVGPHFRRKLTARRFLIE
jgi:hypothetical protein